MLFPLHDNNPTYRTPFVTIGLVAANILIYLGMSLQPPEQELRTVVLHAFTPNRVTRLFEGQPGRVRVSEDVEVELAANPQLVLSTLFTCMFLHGSWAHVLGNMWFLWLFGNNIEDRLGPIRFILFYLVGGLGATGMQWFIGPLDKTPVIGASGAVAAVLGAYAVSYPHARVHSLLFFGLIMVVDLPALWVLGIWLAMQVLEGLSAFQLGVSGGVAWWAHIGGFVAGMALIKVFEIGVPPQDPSLPHRDWRPMSRRIVKPSGR
jgi:membrane associated rhomboid family serine protease